jgi:hypothetical protein
MSPKASLNNLQSIHHRHFIRFRRCLLMGNNISPLIIILLIHRNRQV